MGCPLQETITFLSLIFFVIFGVYGVLSQSIHALLTPYNAMFNSSNNDDHI